MKQTKLIIMGLITGIVLLLVLAVVAHGSQGQCNANNPTNCPIPSPICDNGEHVGNPHCITPTPEVTLTPTPTDTQKCGEDCITPEVTPTATPTAEVTPTNTPLRTDLSDNKSDGGSSCPECTQPHNAGFGPGNPNWRSLPLK